MSDVFFDQGDPDFWSAFSRWSKDCRDDNTASTLEDFVDLDPDEVELSRLYAKISGDYDRPNPNLIYPDDEQVYAEASPEDGSPEHFSRYLHRFIFPNPRYPFYIRREYGSPFFQKNYRKGGRKGQPCVLGGDFLRHIVNEHLTGDLWLGLTMPRTTRQSCLDIDAKEYVVAHVRQGNRPLPIVLLTLEHLQHIKRLYDRFPGRIWSISSQTLGIHAWETFSAALPSQKVHHWAKSELEQIGLGSLEVHPMPGRCLRRPFGRDYYTIHGETGKLIEPWQAQLDYFETGHGPAVGLFGPSPNLTPGFPAIVKHLWQIAAQQIALLQSAPERDCHWEWLFSSMSPNVLERKLHLLGLSAAPKQLRSWHVRDGWRRQAEQILRWREEGFELPPENLQISVPAANVGKFPAPEYADMDRSSLRSDRIGGSPADHRRPVSSPVLDISDFRGGRWAFKLEEIARIGLPGPEAIQIVLPEMAKWLWWIELFSLPQEDRHHECFRLIWNFVKRKHNGHVTRLSTGKEKEVISQIHRAIKRAADVQEKSKAEFALVRQKRQSGQYKRVINIAPLLVGDLGESSVSSSSSPVYLYIVPHFPALPDEVADRLKAHSGRAKIDDFAVKLANFLFQRGGTASVTNAKLREICGTRSHRQASRYRDILVRAGIISIGSSYQVGEFGKRHSLNNWVMRSMRRALKDAQKAEQQASGA